MVVREYTINPGETIKITSPANAPKSSANAPKPSANAPKPSANPFNPFNNNNAKPSTNASSAKPNASSAKPNNATVKSKRPLSAAMVKMGENRAAIFENLKRKWAEENPSFASLNASALRAAVARGEVKKKPVFSDALQEHSRRQREGNPEKEAKHAAYRSKVESARVAKSVPAPAAAVESKVRKNPWANLSENQRKNRIAKMQQGKSAKKAKPANSGYVELPAGPKNSEVVAASANNVEAFKPFTLKGEEYWKNGLNYVYAKTSEGGFGDYVGKYDATKDEIDTTVEEPPIEGGRRKTRRNRKNRRSTRRNGRGRNMRGGGLREDALAYLKKEGKEPGKLLLELHTRNPNGSYTSTTKTMGGFTFKSDGHPAQSMTLKAKKENNANDKYENIFSYSDH